MIIFRQVMVQNGGPENVSTVPIGEHEIAEHLGLEASLHALAGWKVWVIPASDYGPLLVCYRGTQDRIVYYRAFDPAQDGEKEV